MTSTDNYNSIKQIVIISLTSCLLFFIFVFLFWTYNDSKIQNRDLILEDIKNTQKMLEDLGTLKVRELNTIAKGISYGPLLKGALASQHLPTIEDVLRSIKNKNKVDFILVLKDKRIQYRGVDKGHEDSSIKEIAAGHFIGKAKIKDKFLIIGKKLISDDLTLWKKMTNASFEVMGENDKIALSNYTGKSVKGSSKTDIQLTSDNKFYYSTKKLLKGTLNIKFYLSAKPYNESFERKRNSLIILGVVLLFIGLVLSVAISKLLFNFLNKAILKKADSGNFNYLIEEIETLKKKLIDV